ncbi:MAG: 4-aminobutyrate aminotransferase [Solibacillus sp.]
MDEIIGYAVVFIIIAGLFYALVKQIKETRSSEHIEGSPLFRKQMARKNKVMTVALFGILVFYTLNILSGIASSIQVSDSFTVRGTLLSFFVYFYARLVMKPKQVDHIRNLYN